MFIRNRCVIDILVALLCRHFSFLFSVGIGAFLIRLSQISSFFSLLRLRLLFPLSFYSYAKRYSPRLEEDITRMMEALRGYHELVGEVFTINFLNFSKMHIVSEEFLDSCEDYYHAKSVLYFETIDRPERILIEVIAKFEKAQRDLEESRNFILNNVENLQRSANILTEHCLIKLESEFNDSMEYFVNESITKEYLSKMYISKDFVDDINNVTLFFQEVRNRGQNIFDGWTSFIHKINEIWKQAIEYEGLRDFYEYRNYSIFLQNYTDVEGEITMNVSSTRDGNDLRYCVGTIDTDFQTSVTDITEALSMFMESIQVNEKLLR